MNEEIRKAFNSMCKLGQDKGVTFSTTPSKFKAQASLVDIVKTALSLSDEAGYGFKWHAGNHYIFTGMYWQQISKKQIMQYLSAIARIGQVLESKAYNFKFADDMYEQFRYLVKDMYLQENPNVVKINTQSGTVRFDGKTVELGKFDRDDFFTYVLKYPYNPTAPYPMFQKFLDDILPRNLQAVVQEFVGSIFIPNKNFQKIMIFLGQGRNGKGTLMNIISAILGRENVSHHSLASLCKEDSRSAANLENKLLNLCNELDGKFSTSTFKQLVAGDIISVRKLYGEEYDMFHYAKLLFSANSLPQNAEKSEVYYDRFAIVPFKRCFKGESRDESLEHKIIEAEADGVLTWVVEGAKRLMAQGKFSHAQEMDDALEEYKIESDSVASFMDENNYESNTKEILSLQYLFDEYNSYCKSSNFHPCSRTTFSKRLEALGFKKKRISEGNVFFIKKVQSAIEEPQVINPTAIPETSITDFFSAETKGVKIVERLPKVVTTSELFPDREQREVAYRNIDHVLDVHEGYEDVPIAYIPSDDYLQALFWLTEMVENDRVN